MTPFELGYEAFLKGQGKDANPFDADTCPCSRKRWDAGWKACSIKRAEVLK